MCCQARTYHCSQVAREPPLIGLGVWSRALAFMLVRTYARVTVLWFINSAHNDAKGSSFYSVEARCGDDTHVESPWRNAQNQCFFGITFTSSAILPTIDQSEAHAIKICLGEHAPRPP